MPSGRVVQAQVFVFRHSSSIEDMINIGDLANPNITPETARAYELMEQNSSGRDFEVTADANGVVWFIVGTDSGFEGLTTLYYGTISVVMEQD